MDQQLYRLQFERADLLKHIEEDQDDLNDLMQKHKDLIAQVVAAAARRLDGLVGVGGDSEKVLLSGHSLVLGPWRDKCYTGK